MDVSDMISSLSCETNSLSEFFNSCEPRHKSSETRTEMVYKPDPDIAIEEFKQTPIYDILSSDPDLVANETLISDQTR